MEGKLLVLARGAHTGKKAADWLSNDRWEPTVNTPTYVHWEVNSENCPDGLCKGTTQTHTDIHAALDGCFGGHF